MENWIMDFDKFYDKFYDQIILYSFSYICYTFIFSSYFFYLKKIFLRGAL